MKKWRSPRNQFIAALVVSSLVSVGLFGYGAWRNHSLEFAYLLWNLFLAWLPLLLAVRLVGVLRQKRWSSWEGLALSLLWLVFLPNSFYMISDFIHLQEVQRVDVLYDAVMFTSFIYTGVTLGFSSLYLVHLQLKRRFSRLTAAGWVAFTLLICSVAIYVGRDLRWNSWDVLTNPGGLLFDISDRVLHPEAYPQMFVTVISFFVLLISMYGLLWRGAELLRRPPRQQPVHYLAFYGTLRQSGQTPMHPLIGEHLIYEGSCQIPGRLYDIGRLKALKSGEGAVDGDLYRLKDLEVLPQLDHYEAIDNVDPTLPGFSRSLVHLIKPDVPAWVYFYDGPVNDTQRIPSGKADK